MAAALLALMLTFPLAFPGDAHSAGAANWLKLKGGTVLGGAESASSPSAGASAGAASPAVQIDAVLEQSEPAGMFAQSETLLRGSESGGMFGYSVALSANGDTALIGAPHDGDLAGAVWVFTRSGPTSGWTQQGPALAIGEEGQEESGEECGEAPAEEQEACDFGRSLALSADGNTALIGAPFVNARQGAAWVFTRSGETWTQQGPALTGGKGSGGSRFGTSVALSADGNTALIGAPLVDGVKGAAWVFTRSGETWTQQGPKLTGDKDAHQGCFGASAALSAGGDTALIGGPCTEGFRGAAWAFTRSGKTWTQQGPRLTGGEESGEGRFGRSVALSANGSTALIGGPGDDEHHGAAWAFTRSEAAWTQQGPKLTGGKSRFGRSVALSAEGDTALIGSPGDDEQHGAAWAFTRSGEAWTRQEPELTGDQEHGAGRFGASVALSADGQTALIGGPDDEHKAGAVWTFRDILQPPPEQTPPIVLGIGPESGPGGSSAGGSSAGGSTSGDTSDGQTSGPPASGGTTGTTARLGVLAFARSALPAPQLGVSANLTPVSGHVLVRLPRSKAFAALTAPRQVPFGTIVNANRGKVSVTTASSRHGIQTMTFYEGELAITQARTGLVTATLVGGDFSACPAAREGGRATGVRSKHVSAGHVVRKLWAEGRGSYSTRGDYATGARSLSTRWLTEDLCDGTLIHVATARLEVENLVNHRHLIVKAGHSYLAKAP